ncbi:hypothetical protein HPB47_019975, partial [Ixodes persulcatus]
MAVIWMIVVEQRFEAGSATRNCHEEKKKREATEPTARLSRTESLGPPPPPPSVLLIIRESIITARVDTFVD